MWKWFLFFCLLHGFVFLPSFQYPFIRFDDWWIVNNPWFSNTFSLEGFRSIFLDFSKDGRMLHGAEYLPIRDLSAAVQYNLFGSHPFGYRITQWVLYVISSALVFHAFLSLGYKKEIVFSGWLIFLFHPLHVEPLVWLSSHKDVLSFFFLSASLLFYVRGRTCGAMLTFGLGVLTKYHLIVFPLALVALDFFFRREKKWMAYAWFFAISLGAWAIATRVSDLVNYGHFHSAWPAWMFLPQVLFGAFGHWVMPFSLHLIYDYAQEPSMGLWLAAVCTVGLLAGLAAYNRKVFFCLLWGVVFLFPMLKAPNMHFLADRYLLIPSVGFSIVSAHVLMGICMNPPRWRLVAMALGILIYATFYQTKIWSSDLALWKHAIKHHPGHPVIQKNLAAVYLKDRDWSRALFWYRKVTGVVPREDHEFVTFWNNRGLAEYQLGLYHDAKASFERSLSKAPTYAAYLNLGVLYAGKKDNVRAREYFEKATAFEKNKVDPIFNLILLCLNSEKKESCRRRYEPRLRWIPQSDPRGNQLRSLLSDSDR